MRFLLLLAAAALAAAQPTVEELLERKLLDRIAAFDRSFDGVLGVAALDLTTGRLIQYNCDTVFPQASSIKIPILMEVYAQAATGRLRFTDSLSVTPAMAIGGSGVIQNELKAGLREYTFQRLAEEMIVSSDNTATNLLIAKVGMANVNALLDRLGFPKTRLRRIMLDQAAASRNDENVSTPREMVRLVELLYRDKVPGSRDMLATMRRVDADLRAALPPNVPVAAKPGELTGVRCETGIVYLPNRPYAVAIMTTAVGNDENHVGAVARLLHNHFGRLAHANAYGNLGVR
ncbi:MAG: class A beta-lactamase-related serine hydrolase [Bryobacter sp.]|nr:class A beta-lactamase-related serine hydrolase [Bryobacter sp.]